MREDGIVGILTFFVSGPQLEQVCFLHYLWSNLRENRPTVNEQRTMPPLSLQYTGAFCTKEIAR